MQNQSIKDLPIMDLVDTTNLAREYLDDVESVFWAIRMLGGMDGHPDTTRSHIVRLAGVGERLAAEAADTFASQKDVIDAREVQS